jgi:MFS family permease
LSTPPAPTTASATPAAAATAPTLRVPRSVALAFLGVLGAVQGAAPNISSTALVSASRHLDMVGGTLTLAASIQTLAIAATVISTGLLADRFGRRNILMLALVVGVVGNLVIASAPAATFYLLGQALTGIGLGAVFGAAFAYVRVIADPRKLAAAIGLFTAAMMLSTLILTFAGGALASADWRLAFVLIPAVGALCVVLTPVILPRQGRIPNPKKDYLGQLLLISAIAGFLYGVSQLGNSLTAVTTLGPLALGVLLAVLFFWRESRNPNRFFPVSLFRTPVFIAAIFAGLVYNFGTAVAFLQVTNLWQYVNGLETAAVALWQLPLIATGIVAALLFGRLMTRGMSNRVALLIGAVSTSAGFVLLAVFHTSQSFLGFLPGLILVGGGVVIAAIPFGNLILKEAPAAFYGPVTSSKTTIGQFFYSIGFAVSTVVIDKMTRGGTVGRLEAAGVPPQQVGTGLDAVNAYASRGTTPKTSLGKEALADAVTSYGGAFATMMVIAGAVVLVAGVIGFLILRRHHAHAERAPEAVADPSTVTG